MWAVRYGQFCIKQHRAVYRLASADILVGFWGPIHISGMAEARAVKFFMKGDYIKSCQEDSKSPSKGGGGMVMFT